MKRINWQLLLTVATMIFAIGSWSASQQNGSAIAANQAAAAVAEVKEQAPRIAALERRADASEAAMKDIAATNLRALALVEAIQKELKDHELLDARDSAAIQRNIDEINRLRASVR